MNSYELTVIMDPDIAEEEVPQAIEKINELIAKSGGEVSETNHWGRRRLAYPIGRHGEGNYILLNLTMDPAKVVELEANLNMNETFLRHLIVKLDG